MMKLKLKSKDIKKFKKFLSFGENEYIDDLDLLELRQKYCPVALNFDPDRNFNDSNAAGSYLGLIAYNKFSKDSNEFAK